MKALRFVAIGSGVLAGVVVVFTAGALVWVSGVLSDEDEYYRHPLFD